MGKRKRPAPQIERMGKAASHEEHDASQVRTEAPFVENGVTDRRFIQIIIGTYEKVLHGIKASWSSNSEQEDFPSIDFADNFLFCAHESAIKCLAISPEIRSVKKRLLATGGTDQAVNVYSLSTVASEKPVENHKNRELGALQHHSGAVNTLCFPTTTKLLTASDDNTIAVARTRDWTILSSIKAPAPKISGQPSGDTVPAGTGIKGINDFDVHPSLKLMISVGKGERCMRLWNLVTGKKAAVLNVDRAHLIMVGETKFTTGEARKVRWNNAGDEFTLVFDRGCIVYGLNSKPKCCLLPLSRTRLHQVRYFAPVDGVYLEQMLLLSTESGQILFFPAKSHVNDPNDSSDILPSVAPVAQLCETGGLPSRRIKDFEVFDAGDGATAVIVTGSSDGVVRIWSFEVKVIIGLIAHPNRETSSNPLSTGNSHSARDDGPLKQVGRLLGTYEVGNRITCLKAFPLSEADAHA